MNIERSYRRLFNLSIVAGFSVLISLLGLGREIITARLLGVGNNYDCFVAAFSLISFFLVLFNQQNIQSLYLPDYHRKRLQNEKLSYQFKMKFGAYLITLTTLIALFVYLFAEKIINLVFPSFSLSKLLLTTDLLRLMVPIIVLNATLGVFHSHFHSRNQFLYPAIGQFINSALIIILMFNGELSVHWLAEIYLLSMGACWVFTALPLLRHTLPFKSAFQVPSIKIVENGAFILLIACIEQLLQLWFRSCFATFGDGILSEFGYAWKLIYFPIYLVGFSVSTAFFPNIVNEVSHPTADKKNIKVSSQINLILLVLAASFLYFFAFEISILLFGQRAMGFKFLHSIANLLQWFSFYIIIIGMNIYLTRLVYLCKKSKQLFIGLLVITVAQVLTTNLLISKYAQFSIPLAATFWGTVFIMFQLLLLKKSNIRIMSTTDFMWASIPGSIVTALYYYMIKPVNLSIWELMIAGMVCFFLSLAVNFGRKDGLIHNFLRKEKILQ
jgi:putative peptidoglycan lipid II flippase